MAPRKRKAEGGEEAPKPETTSMRITRSSTRRANSNSTESATELSKPELPRKNKKAKPAAKRKKEEGEVEETEPDKQKSEDEAGGDESKLRTIVIEHCKQCNSFKTRAIQVKAGLEKDVPGITVLLNPEKPRRGCFEIREEGGEKFISLLDMVRPFKPMKNLDMTKVISDIVDKLK